MSGNDLNSKDEAKASEKDSEKEEVETVKVDQEHVEDVGSSDYEEETRTPKVAMRPKTPTQKDLDDHLPLHLHYRAWCPECVAGRGTQTPHLTQASEDKGNGATVHMDYAFQNQKDKDDDKNPILVAYEELTRMFWAMSVKHKGVHKGPIKYLVDKLEEAGFCGERVTMKSDQERSIVAFKSAVAASRKGETALIESPVRSSQSNGRAERAIRKWRDQYKTLRLYLERMIGRKVPNDSPLLTWLVTWTSDALSKFLVLNGGKTAYEQATGHKCKHVVVGFGERVMFQTIPDKNHIDKKETNRDTGVFFGVVTRTTE